jgi:hypothetical protein
MPVSKLVLCCLVALTSSLTACYGPDPNLTASGKGKPLVSVEFPAEVQRSSTHTAVVEVTNPGPGDMAGFAIEFSLVGLGGTQGVPTPLVITGSQEQSPSIAGVDPEPRAVSLEGVRFFFGALDEDESETVRFDIIAPDEPGTAANAVIVSDTEEGERSRGVRLVTEVTR